MIIWTEKKTITAPYWKDSLVRANGNQNGLLKNGINIIKRFEALSRELEDPFWKGFDGLTRNIQIELFSADAASKRETSFDTNYIVLKVLGKETPGLCILILFFFI